MITPLIAIIAVTLFNVSCKKQSVSPPECNGNDVKVTSNKIAATGLNDPRGLKFGPDGKLYVYDWGIGTPGAGQIIQVSFMCEEVHADSKSH